MLILSAVGQTTSVWPCDNAAILNKHSTGAEDGKTELKM